MRSVRDECDASGGLRKIRDRLAESFLHVDDEQRRLLLVEKLLVPHIDLF